MRETLDLLTEKYNISRDAFFEKIINFLSRQFFFRIYPLNFFKSPNQITLLGLTFGILSFLILFNYDNFFLKFLSSLFLFIFICCDYIDGDFARLENKSSSFGKYLDSLSDLLILFLIIFFNLTKIIESEFYHFYLVGLSIMPLLLKASNKKKNNNSKNNFDEKKIKKNLFFKKLYNNYFRPTFTNIVCYFILLNLLNLNVLFCILIGFSSIALFINNQINLLKK